LETVLDTNRVMLEKGRARIPASIRPDQVIEPVYIEDGVTLVDSRVGPNVSIGAGSVIERSEIRDAIIGGGTRIVRSRLTSSMIGEGSVIEGFDGALTVADHSEVRA
jgi:glucose-1-phosphate thymidylyltransferase